MGVNYGLLGTAAEGVQAGLNAWQTTQKMKRDSQIQNLAMGLTQNENGDLSYTPEKQEEINNQRQADTLKQKGLIADYAPASQDEISTFRQHMNMVKPGMGDAADLDGVSHHQLIEKEGLLAPDVSGNYSVRAAREKAVAGQIDNTPKRITDRLTKLNETIDPNRPRGGNLAKAQGMMNSADRIDALLNQFPDGNVPKAQTHELATAAAGLVSGGSPQSQEQINSILPRSLIGDTEGIAGWLGNDPKGLQQQAFIKALADSSHRERDVADEQVHSAQVQDLAGYQDLAASAPDKYNKILSTRGLTPEMIDTNGAYIPKSKRAKQQGLGSGGLLSRASDDSHPQDSTAVAWAKANSGDPRAAAILNANGL